MTGYINSFKKNKNISSKRYVGWGFTPPFLNLITLEALTKRNVSRASCPRRHGRSTLGVPAGDAHATSYKFFLLEALRLPVIPAQAGIHFCDIQVDTRLRGYDSEDQSV